MHRHQIADILIIGSCAIGITVKIIRVNSHHT